jgi:uncharacterized membrane protein YccC
MQRENKWQNWPVLAGGIILIIICLLGAKVLEPGKILPTYLADVAGALTAVVISVGTYDEWERRRERERYKKPEEMGARRIQDEVFQLLYQFAFFLNLRFNPSSYAMETVEKSSRRQDEAKELLESDPQLKAKAAKQIAFSDEKINKNLQKLALQALKKPDYKKQTYAEANELINQIQNSIYQVDIAIATYGYSFTPEAHKWSLDVREGLSQSITNESPIISIRLAARSQHADDKLGNREIKSLSRVVDELINCGQLAEKVSL